MPVAGLIGVLGYNLGVTLFYILIEGICPMFRFQYVYNSFVNEQNRPLDDIFTVIFIVATVVFMT